MIYRAIVMMSADAALTSRVSASAAHEGIPEPRQWTADNMAAICAEPGWVDAWEAAARSGNENPGQDISVITDHAIVAAIRVLRPRTSAGTRVGRWDRSSPRRCGTPSRQLETTKRVPYRLS
jgi:hypothetical protein